MWSRRWPATLGEVLPEPVSHDGTLMTVTQPLRISYERTIIGGAYPVRASALRGLTRSGGARGPRAHSLVGATESISDGANRICTSSLGEDTSTESRRIAWPPTSPSDPTVTDRHSKRCNIRDSSRVRAGLLRDAVVEHVHPVRTAGDGVAPRRDNASPGS